MKKKLIYVVEDDYHQAQWTLERIKEEFGESVEVQLITTHYQFNQRLEEIGLRLPVCIILDVMLPWTDTEVSEQPANMDSFMTAGIDCLKKLHGDPRTAAIPVLIYTVLDRSDLTGLPDGTAFLRKDSPDYRMIAWVKEALSKG